MPIEIQVALIAAITSTIITPLVQLGVNALRREKGGPRKRRKKGVSRNIF